MNYPQDIQQQIIDELLSEDVIVFVMSREGKYLSLLGGSNRSFYSDGINLIGKRYKEVLREEKALYFQSLIDKVVQTEKPLEADYELGVRDFIEKTRNGPAEPQRFHVTVLPFKLIESAPLDRVLWIVRNVTKEEGA